MNFGTNYDSSPEDKTPYSLIGNADMKDYVSRKNTINDSSESPFDENVGVINPNEKKKLPPILLNKPHLEIQLHGSPMINGDSPEDKNANSNKTEKERISPNSTAFLDDKSLQLDKFSDIGRQSSLKKFPSNTELLSGSPNYIEIPIYKDNMAKNIYNGAEKEEENEDPYNMMTNLDIILLKNVHKTYLLGIEGITALRGVSLAIKEKEFICILGTSGGGKTTMLNIIGTIDKPTKGEVFIDGHKIKQSTDDKILAGIRLNKIAFVFQTFNLLSSMTALENVELPMILRGDKSRDEIKRKALELLEEVGLKERINHFPNQLSGGEQQRVTIARALSNEPKILLLDEPTGDLDTKNTDLIMNIIVDLNVTKGITVIMVTHDLALKGFAHRIVRMVDGKINKIEINPPRNRKQSIQHLKRTIKREYNIQVQGLEYEAEDLDNDNFQQTNLGVREGIKYIDRPIQVNSQMADFGYKFQMRKGTDYPAVAFAKDIKQKNNRMMK